jgi:N-methylhydantoinase B
MAAIPGSEKFNATGELDESKIDSSLALHESPGDRDLDRVTFEVLRNRLARINDEQGITLQNVSGSPIATDANDFNVVIADERGEIVNFGQYVMFLGGALDVVIKWILEHRSGDPGIQPGDMFLCNDPWVGGVHQNDVAVVSPVFHEDELFGWTASTIHQVDVGGVNPGSFCVDADDVFAEAQPTPPVKIVENGEIRTDIEEMFLRRSRAPPLVGMDLRAHVASNNVAKERIHDQIDNYGANTVKSVMKETIDHAEESLRSRLRELPDGVWRHVEYQEVSQTGDRGVYKARLEMEKKDDKLIFNVSGDPPSGMFNCTYPAMRGGFVSAVLPMLCHDIPWALGGIYRVMEINSEDDIIINADFPAGTSMGATSGAWQAMNLANKTVAGMLAASDDHDHELIAGCCGSWATINMMGVNQYDDPFVTMIMDPMAGGWGAGSDSDGIDTGGILCTPKGQTPNVEANELSFPMLYLYRREEPDSGGPGEYRGGTGGSMCWMPHDTEVPITNVVSVFGAAMPTSPGISGGHPSNAVRYEMIRDSDITDWIDRDVIPSDKDDIAGDTEVMPPKYQTQQGLEDVYYCLWQGGGGFGDPIDREPEAVAEDVRNGYVSEQEAEETYGVVLTSGGSVDESKTVAKRETIRERRFEAEPRGESE